ncbi:hypothetical protein [Rhodococcus sp. (in: high G+C Gram-positive bacteria)]|uniref:hypothetical protein n=1 Tax=Rhodococcus sp. TaxID=1831 RepID=UPI00257DAEE3|nr:hypothetical protein [Rhodococcus sp. (in: high G+C Gram-positive bacteria)]
MTVTKAEKSALRWKPILLLTVLGAVCGLVALGVFQWWWQSLASPHILTGGAYFDPEPGFTGASFMDLFPAEPAPWLYSDWSSDRPWSACSPASCSCCSAGGIVVVRSKGLRGRAAEA